MKANDYMKHFDFNKIYEEAPGKEPERQLYFIRQVKALFKARFQFMIDSGEAKRQFGEEQIKEMLEIPRRVLYTFRGIFNARQ